MLKLIKEYLKTGIERHKKDMELIEHVYESHTIGQQIEALQQKNLEDAIGWHNFQVEQSKKKNQRIIEFLSAKDNRTSDEELDLQIAIDVLALHDKANRE